MIDFAATLTNPLFAVLGRPGTLALADSRSFDVTVIDKTSGVQVGSNVEVPTVMPCAALNYVELAGLGLNKDDLIDGTLAFNGKSWTITNLKSDPNPSGERAGQLYAILSEPHELGSST